jgi:hypothetical protein
LQLLQENKKEGLFSLSDIIEELKDGKEPHANDSDSSALDDMLPIKVTR